MEKNITGTLKLNRETNKPNHKTSPNQLITQSKEN